MESINIFLTVPGTVALFVISQYLNIFSGFCLYYSVSFLISFAIIIHSLVSLNVNLTHHVYIPYMRICIFPILMTVSAKKDYIFMF